MRSLLDNLPPSLKPKVPFLIAGFLSFLFSVYLYFGLGEGNGGHLVGLWVPSIDSLGTLIATPRGQVVGGRPEGQSRTPATSESAAPAFPVSLWGSGGGGGAELTKEERGVSRDGACYRRGRGSARPTTAFSPATSCGPTSRFSFEVCCPGPCSWSVRRGSFEPARVAVQRVLPSAARCTSSTSPPSDLPAPPTSVGIPPVRSRCAACSARSAASGLVTEITATSMSS